MNNLAGIKRILPVLVLSVAALSASAEVEDSTIVNVINSGSVITIEQPEGLNERLVPGQKVEAKEETQVKTSKKQVGYRVQVFSDNNVRTAKTEAQSRARKISSRFSYQTYVVFTSPYWRLKVGDFRTQGEAQEAAREIKAAFPSYGKEMRIVKDYIVNRD
jgi:hypothetical protein